MTAGVFSYAPKQSVLIYGEMTILFIIYTLRFAAKSATYGSGIYADVKSKSVVLKILKKQDFRFYAGVTTKSSTPIYKEQSFDSIG